MAAQKDLWIVGDKFVSDVFHTLPKLRNALREAHRQIPYIYEYYNITCFTQNPVAVNDNTVACILNSVMKALNDNTKIPRIILIIPDYDILRYIGFFGFGESHVIGSTLNWLICNVENTIDSKREEFRKKKPGALHNSEPKVIWMKIFDRPIDARGTVTSATKFNNLLEELVMPKRYHFTLDISAELVPEPINFLPHSSQLSHRGAELLWSAVDHAIEDFDFQRIDKAGTAHTGPVRNNINPKASSRQQLQQTQDVTSPIINY